VVKVDDEIIGVEGVSVKGLHIDDLVSILLNHDVCKYLYIILILILIPIG